MSKSLLGIWKDYLSGSFHAPGYNYLGPGTKNMNRPPVNELDELARQHDIDYGYIGSGAYTYYNWADRKFLEGIRKLKAQGFSDTYADIAYQIFDTKRRFMPHMSHKFNERMPYKRGKKRYKRAKRRRSTFARNRIRKRLFRKRVRRAPKPGVYVPNKLFKNVMVKKLLKSGYSQERYRIDRGSVTTSALNECSWNISGTATYNELQSRLATLEVYDPATDARKTLANIHNDVNFNCYVKRSGMITIINNQEVDETPGAGVFYPRTNIRVHVYFVTPKYPRTNTALTDLQQAFVSNGLSNDLVSRDKFMFNAPYFRRLYNVTSHGMFNMNPGEKRVLIHKHKPKWWRRYKEQILGTDYAKEWEGYWLIRQQGDIAMNPVTDADAAKPFWCASRLTFVTQENVSIYYNPNATPIKTNALITSTQLDTAITSNPVTEVPQEVDEEKDQEMVLVQTTLDNNFKKRKYHDGL